MSVSPKVAEIDIRALAKQSRNNWLWGADSDAWENFAANRRHGLRVMSVWGVAFQLGTTSEIDARLSNLRERAPQHILKV